MAGPNRETGVSCPGCGEEARWSKGRLWCPTCSRTLLHGSPVPVVAPEPGWGDEDVLRAQAEALGSGDRVFAGEGGQWLVTPAGLVDLNKDTLGLLAQSVRMATQHGSRYLGQTEAAALWAYLRGGGCLLLRAVDFVAPRSVLHRNAEGGLVHTARGHSLASGGGVWTREEVAPAETGEWRRLLDSVCWNSDEDRRVYEAVCMTALLPFEAEQYPLVVAHADGPGAGKSWLGYMLSWALGYADAASLTGGRDKLRRRIVSAASGFRVLIFDNMVGTGGGLVEDNMLSEVTTKGTLQGDALYRSKLIVMRNLCIFFLTLNQGGQIAEDLAMRSVTIELDSDTGRYGGRVAARDRDGAFRWKRPEVSRAVLAELLLETQRRWEATRGWRLPEGAVLGRHPEWKALAWRLTGSPMPPPALEVRGLADVDPGQLRALLGGGKTAGEVAAAAANLQLGPLSQVARRPRGADRAVGGILRRLRDAGLPLTCRTLHGSPFWEWNEAVE